MRFASRGRPQQARQGHHDRHHSRRNRSSNTTQTRAEVTAGYCARAHDTTSINETSPLRRKNKRHAASRAAASSRSRSEDAISTLTCCANR
jgi:hypothetical protein